MSHKLYNNRTLEGNWFEDRFSPPQPSESHPQQQDLRPRQNAISWLGSAGVPKPLNILKRKKKWNTEGVIPDDGYRQMYTTAKTEIPHPGITREQQSKPPSFKDPLSGQTHSTLNKGNISHITTNRELPGPLSGFGAALPSHAPEYEKRYFQTTYAQTMGQGYQTLKKPAEGYGNQFQTTNMDFFGKGQEVLAVQAGVTAKNCFMELSAKQRNEILTAEILRTGNDPQHNTMVQKTWIPGGDPALRERSRGIQDGLPEVDNENSLPMGQGAYFKMFQNLGKTGFRRVTSDVTTAPAEHLNMGFR